MSTCGVKIPQGSSASCVPHADASSPKVSRPPLSTEISSHWNCSGRLSCELQKQPSLRCVSDGDKGYHSVCCVHTLKDARCSSRSQKKVPPVFPINLSFHFGAWLAQLFNGNVSVENGSTHNTVTTETSRFESFLRKYQAEKNLDPLQTFSMQPCKDISCAPFSPRGSDESTVDSTVLADRNSAIPSVDVLKTAPYFDLLPSKIAEASELVRCTTEGDISFLTGSLIPKYRVLQTDYFVTPDRLGSPDALAAWLNDRLPLGISQWGAAPGTKRVVNLWIELKDGEIVLEDSSPPRRTVHVVSVKIKNKSGHMLVEAHQEMADGSIRSRNRPLSEKIRRGENVEEACFRGIFEELGSQLGAKNRVRIVSGSHMWKQEERESLSYPGLLTCYVIHSLDAMVEDLPDTGFYTVENEHSFMELGQLSPMGGGFACNGTAVGVRKHFWRWVPQPS